MMGEMGNYINEDEWLDCLDEEGILEDWNALIPDVKQMIKDSCINHGVSLINELYHCESPIEWKLGIAIYNYFNLVGFGNGSFILNPQYEIETINGKYRVDFLIAVLLNGKGYSLAVECDGHDFHERTKEQAAKDKKRDRSIKLTGLDLIRFTGSEIYANSRECAKEIAHQLTAMAEREVK